MFQREKGVQAISYEERIYNRSLLHYIVGLYPRLKQYLKYSINRAMARHKGATIANNAIIHWSLAKRANKNLTVGRSSIIEKTAFLDLRSKVSIGNNVIINGDVTILRASHDVDDPYFATIFNDLIIEDYAWICTGCVVMPQTSVIGKGAIVGAYSVLTTKEVQPMQIMAGNPAKVVKQRKNVHHKLVTEYMKGGDFRLYWKNRKWFRLPANKKRT